MGRKTEGGRNRVRNRGSSQVQAEELRERQYPGRKHIMYLYSNTDGEDSDVDGGKLVDSPFLHRCL
jgi:hypothetical protein